MNEAVHSEHAAVLRRAAQRALLAPSVHNTQPWRFVLTGDALEIHADPGRGLTVLDPRQRQLTISCGCALFNARVAIAAAGYAARTERLPEPERPNLLARISIGERTRAPIGTLDDAIDQRRTNRRQFGDNEVSRALITQLVDSARAEGAVLIPVATAEHRAAVARLTTLADHAERADPAYLDEIMAWTTDDPRRRDGVQAATVPYVGDGSGSADPLPIRGFDVRGMGWLPSASRSGAEQCLLLLCCTRDQPADWLRAGEALERVWLEITREGYWASPLTQVVEVCGTHERLCAKLRLREHPQLLLRVGRAQQASRTPRRLPEDVIVEGDRR
jgi:hypothetical protein